MVQRVKAGSSSAYTDRWRPPHGTEVDMMGGDRLLQLMTRGGDRDGNRWELVVLYYSDNGLYRI